MKIFNQKDKLVELQVWKLILKVLIKQVINLAIKSLREMLILLTMKRQMMKIEKREEIKQAGVIVQWIGKMKVIRFKRKVKSEPHHKEQIIQLLNPQLGKISLRVCNKCTLTQTTGIIKVSFSTKNKRISLLFTVMNKLLN